MRNYIISGVNLQPGTSVLLVAPDYMSEDDLYAMREELQSRFSGVKFVFLSGDFQLIGSYQTDDVKVIEA